MTTTLMSDREKLVEARQLNIRLLEELEQSKKTKARMVNRDALQLARTVRKLGTLPAGSEAAANALESAFTIADRLAA